MNPQEVAEQIENCAKPLTLLFQQLDTKDQLDTQFNSRWTIKDILAHIVWYEEEILKLVENRSLSDTSDIWDYDVDHRNRLVDEAMEATDEEELLERHQQVVEDLVAVISSMDQELMTDPSYYEQMPKDWTPWKIIGGSTFFHYTDHLRRLEEFMEEQIHETPH